MALEDEQRLERKAPAESTPSPDTEGVRLADELTSAIRIGVEDDVTIPFDLSVRIHAFLRTAQNTGRAGSEDSIEVVARALAERQIRQARRFDTEPAELERILPGAIDYHWPSLVDDARAAIRALKSSPPVSTVDEEGGGS